MDAKGAQLLEAILKNAGKRKKSAERMDQAAVAGRIASTAWNITEKDHVLSLEFLGGQRIDGAAAAAYDLLLLSGMPTRLRFNGVEISMTRIED